MNAMKRIGLLSMTVCIIVVATGCGAMPDVLIEAAQQSAKEAVEESVDELVDEFTGELLDPDQFGGFLSKERTYRRACADSAVRIETRDLQPARGIAGQGRGPAR
jgi:hypothetical protein